MTDRSMVYVRAAGSLSAMLELTLRDLKRAVSYMDAIYPSDQFEVTIKHAEQVLADAEAAYGDKS